MRAVLFDLDGTLADTLADLAAAMNHTLAAAGYPTHTPDAYRQLIGEGAENLAWRALPPEARDQAPAIALAFRAWYAEHLIVETRPYPGIPALLDALGARGVPMGVLSNKPAPATEAVMARLFGQWRFGAIAGQIPERPRKPDPAGALFVAAALGVPPEACLFVGDSAIDMETARRANMTPVGVRWGFRGEAELVEAGAQHLLTTPEELLALLT